MQEECFQKANAAMHEELKNQEEPEKVAQDSNKQEEQEVNMRAKAEAEAFLKKEESSYKNLSMEQAYLAFKFVFISEELMVKGLMGMPSGAWQQWNRQMAKQLHPDKNSHPRAKEAFQRV